MKITGVDQSIARFVSDRSQTPHFKGQAEYLRDLIREDMAKAAAERRSRLEGILAPLHAQAEAQWYGEEQLAEIFEKARDEVADAGKRQKAGKS